MNQIDLLKNLEVPGNKNSVQILTNTPPLK